MDSTTSEFDIISLQDGSAVQEFIDQKIKESEPEKDAFFVCDLGELKKRHQRWVEALPRVTPFYAVKSNNRLEIVKTLAELGIGFDCASKNEIQQVMSLGVDPSRIIFANPCKQMSHISYASDHGVQMMTFDSEEELVKMAQHHPTAKPVLRIFTDVSKAKLPLSEKFGAQLHSCRGLLEQAKELGLDVIGVSFHVGSECFEPGAFDQPIADAHWVFEIADELGFKMNLLDIGGGFPGSDVENPLFEKITAVINKALDKYFPTDSTVRIIAEPGCYYSQSCGTLFSNIIAKKVDKVAGSASGQEIEEGTKDRALAYYVNDGIYTSFQRGVKDTPQFLAKPYRKVKEDEVLFPCRVWGQTCNSIDKIAELCYLPDLQVGDWLIYENMGAYSNCSFSTFNGFPEPPIYFIKSHPAL